MIWCSHRAALAASTVLFGLAAAGGAQARLHAKNIISRPSSPGN